MNQNETAYRLQKTLAILAILLTLGLFLLAFELVQTQNLVWGAIGIFMIFPMGIFSFFAAGILVVWTMKTKAKSEAKP